MRNVWVALICVVAVGCGSDDNGGGGNNNVDAAVNNMPDAPGFLDAPPTNVAMITVSGTAEEISANGSGALAGVLIEAFRNGNENMVIASTTTDGLGNYSLTIETKGEKVDGYLKATKTGFKTTYLYPPYALDMDFNNASVFMVKPDTWDTLSLVAQAMQQEGNGIVALIVSDGSSMPIEGAKINSTPVASPPERYNAMVGTYTLPSTMASMTYTDGIGYLFNLPPGKVTVGATKGAMQFKSHQVKAWANELTTTVIVP
jgi:hypothetical protein